MLKLENENVGPILLSFLCENNLSIYLYIIINLCDLDINLPLQIDYY